MAKDRLYKDKPKSDNAGCKGKAKGKFSSGAGKGKGKLTRVTSVEERKRINLYFSA